MRFTNALPTAAAMLAILSDGAMAAPSWENKPGRIDPNAAAPAGVARVPSGSSTAWAQKAGHLVGVPQRDMIPLPHGVDWLKVPQSAKICDVDKAPCRIIISEPADPNTGKLKEHAQGHLPPGGMAHVGDYVCKTSMDCLKPTCFELPAGFMVHGRHMRYEFDLDFQQGKTSIEQAEVKYQQQLEFDKKQEEEWAKEAERNPPVPKRAPWWAFAAPNLFYRPGQNIPL
ncbi:hypothetical protein PspLS_10147 [Pyricularia sp. CBS 133598]|nr:hypothetical protein PspLS_10147 [Pyricularia sp. CBS 133598]